MLVTLLALFTPFASISLWGYSDSVSLAGSQDGAFFWILLVGTIAATVLVFLQEKVAKGVMWVIPGVAIVGTLLSLAELFGNNEAFDYGASRGFGYFMVLIDLILFVAIAIYSIMSLIKKDAAGPVPAYPAYGAPQQPGYGQPQAPQPQAYQAPQPQAPQAFQPQQPDYGQPQAPQPQAYQAPQTPQPQVPQAFEPQRQTDPQQPADGQPQA
ncbi:hypothetical protein BW737_008155 [Actinomyces ruminis]|uniref:Uncharacterized protein n=1 Tax=Actinomyces ruminis TaxID=1937003 RepID=A0ABX4MAJ1_9ACTO|nr:hypothetical protein BW737_008155 [Actinomyces ruminis]